MEYLYIFIAKIVGGSKSYAMKESGKRAGGMNNAIMISLIRSAICVTVSLIIWLCSGAAGTTAEGNLIIVVSGIANAVNLLFWLLSSSVVSLCLLELFLMIGTVGVPILITPLIFPGQTVSVFQWIGCAVLFFAVALIASGETNRDKGNLKKKVLFVFTCMIGAAMYVLSQKVYTFYISGKGLGNIAYYNFLNFVVVFSVFFALFLFIEITAYLKRKRSLGGEEECGKPKLIISTLPFKKIWYLVAFAAVALYIDQYLSTAASTLDSAIYYPMAYGLSLIIAAMLDTFVFGTKLSLKRIVAIVLVVVSMLLVNL